MPTLSIGCSSSAHLKNIETIIIPEDEDANDLKKISTFIMGKFMCDHKKKKELLNHQQVSPYGTQATC